MTKAENSGRALVLLCDPRSTTGCSGLVVDVKGEYRHLAEQYSEQVMGDQAAQCLGSICHQGAGQV